MLTLAAAATTIGVQLFSGYFNYRRSVKQGEKIRAMQQEFEQALQQEGIERAWEKLNQLQNFQKNFEAELHNDRIKKTNRISKDEMTLDAYKKSLENFPLRVPPFVMKDESIDTGIQGESPVAVALHCILCRSNDADFNSHIYKALENKLSQYFTRYFGASSSHPVLFYSGAWKEVADIGSKVENIRTHIASLPTLIISLWIPEEGDLLQFKISLWGIPGMEEIKNEIVIPEGLTYTYQQNQGIYSDDEKKHILKELTPLLEAFISYVADQYYWAYDKVTPLLPSLLTKGEIDTQGNRLLEEYRDKYLEMFENYVVKDNEMNRLNMLVAPEKSLELCEEIEILTNNEKIVEIKRKISNQILEFKKRPLFFPKSINKNKYKF
jgi:hypothetical protein